MADFVNIGGECFNVTGTTQMPPTDTSATQVFVCQNKEQFDKLFGGPNLATIRDLFQRYLPHARPQLEGINESEKQQLRKIVEERIESLKASMESNNGTVKHLQFRKYLKGLEELRKQIDKAEATPSSTKAPALHQRIRDKFPKERVYHVLMELAWHLLHPESIQSNMDTWMALLDSLETLNLGQIVRRLQQTNRIIDIDQVEHAAELGQGVMVKDDRAELRKRLEAIMTLLQTKKYLTMSNNNTGPVVDVASISLPDSMKGGNSTSNNTLPKRELRRMMNPFVSFLTNQYGILAEILTPMDDSAASKPVDDRAASKPKLADLAKLLYICQSLRGQHGIYRITNLTNLDPLIDTFLRSQLGAIQAYLSRATEEQQEVYAESAKLVPALSITSLMNKFGPGHPTEIDKTSSVKFMINGINLEVNVDNLTYDEVIKMKIKEEAEKFFDGSLYLVSTTLGATDTPMMVREIDYSKVKVMENQCPFDIMEDNYFNTFKESLSLENITNVKPTIYNHGMLGLSMILLFERLL